MRTIEAGAEAAETATEIIEQLRTLASSVHALDLVNQVAAWATTGDLDSTGGERFGREAMAEFLVAIAVESGAPAGPRAGPHDVSSAITLLEGLFEAERTHILGRLVEAEGTTIEHRSELLVRLEALLDRMQGYVPHLTEIVEAVFEPIREACVSTVGFCPADVPELILGVVEERQARFEGLLALARDVPEEELDGLDLAQRGELLGTWVIHQMSKPDGDIDAGKLAAATSLPHDEVEALICALTLPWQQPVSLVRPGQINDARRKSILEADSGRRAWPLPWSALHEVFPWFDGLLRDEGHDELRKVVSDSRADVTEEIVAERLRRLFGDDRVHPKFEYPIDKGNWAECDVVVDVPGHALAVECKSGALADEYREGNSEYAESTFSSLITHPFDQTDRAAQFLRSGPAKWRSRGSATKNDWLGVSAVTRIAVTLERIDPLVFVSAETSTAVGHEHATWVICLADLIAVMDILDDKHLFLAYAQLRAELAANPALAAVTETDLLGGFLDNGLKDIRQLLTQRSADRVLQGPSNREINRYFTAVACRVPLPPKPTLRLRARTRKRLDGLWKSDDSTYGNRVLELVLGGKI